MTRRPPIPTPTYTLCPSPPLFRAARELPARAPRLSRLRTPLVVDHMGHLPADAGVAHPGFQHLLGLVRDGAWVKLSGAYRLSTAGFPYHDTIPLARALIEAAPDRCIWGSDRSEEHTSELQSLMRISSALFRFKKKRHNHPHTQPSSPPPHPPPHTTPP